MALYDDKEKLVRVGRAGILVPEIGGAPTFSRSQQGPAGSGGRRGIGAAPLTPVATTPTPAQPSVTAQPPAAQGRKRSLLGLDSDPTGIDGIRKVTNTADSSAAPLFTNIAGTAGTQGMFTRPEAQAAQDAKNDKVFATSPLFADQRAHQVALARAAKPEDYTFRAGYADTRDVFTRSPEEDLARTHKALNLGIRESLARGISPQGLQAATQSLAALQPAAPPAQDLGGLASLLNAQTAQGQLGLGADRLEQDKTIAENRARADSEKAVVELATQSATDINGVIDPTRFETTLGHYSNLLGLNPTGGVGATGGGTEDIANQLRSKGYDETEIQQHLKRKTGQ